VAGKSEAAGFSAAAAVEAYGAAMMEKEQAVVAEKLVLEAEFAAVDGKSVEFESTCYRPTE
jgi:hypothetical protein